MLGVHVSSANTIVDAEVNVIPVQQAVILNNATYTASEF
jgi:hypothetical protein